MTRLIRKIFPYIDDILILLTGEKINAEAATQTIISFITLIATMLNAKLKLVPDPIIISLFVFVMLYTTIFNIVTHVLRIDEETAHDYAFLMSIILSIILIISYIPTIVETTSNIVLILLSGLLLFLSFMYQIFFNILIKVAIIEIEKNKAKYMYPLVLAIYSIMAYGFLILIYKTLLFVHSLL